MGYEGYGAVATVLPNKVLPPTSLETASSKLLLALTLVEKTPTMMVRV
jgi:hypothetical protein